MMLTKKSVNLAWCPLVALVLVRQEGGIISPTQENLFLTCWLATALKQRCFSHDVTPDIEWLLKQRCLHPHRRDYMSHWINIHLPSASSMLCSSGINRYY